VMLAAAIDNALECECGRPKSVHAHACDRCRFLDGATNRAADVISALRDDDLSLAEICLVVYQRHDKSTGRMMHSLTQALMKMGRLRRYWADDLTAVRENAFGRGIVARAGCGRWMYRLTGGAS
jgi:hypothetical protein